MNYYFTGLIILALTILALFVEPAYPRNEYLNNGTNTCNTGDVSISIEQREYESRYRHFNPNNNYNQCLFFLCLFPFHHILHHSR